MLQKAKYRTSYFIFKWSSSLLDQSTSGVNFTNILCATYTRAIPKAQKKTEGLTIFFALLGSLHVKAARNNLVKLTPGLNFTNLFSCSF